MGEKDRICRACGKRFKAKTRRAVYCSNRCRQRVYRRRQEKGR